MCRIEVLAALFCIWFVGAMPSSQRVPAASPVSKRYLDKHDKNPNEEKSG